MTLTAQEQLAEITRQRIFSAVQVLLQEYWLDELTIQRIAARASVSVQSLYRHFGSRDGLLQQVLDQSNLVDEPFPAPPEQLSLADILNGLSSYYELHAETMLKIKAQQARHTSLERQWSLLRQQHHQWVGDNFHVFFQALSSIRQQALEHDLISLTGVGFWAGYRLDQRLSQVELIESWQRILRAVLQSYR